MQFKEGESFDTQIEKAKRLIEKKGGTLFKIYREEGISAYNNLIDERPVMQQLKDDIMNGRVNHIVAFKRNRISRRQQDRKNFFAFLAEHGCKLTLTNTGEEVDIFGKDKLSAITEDLQGHFDEISSKETSENVTDTMWELAMYKGRIMGGQAPIGYKAVYEEKDEQSGTRIPTFVPIEEFQPTRELIEELYLSGYGYASIAKYLNGGKVRGMKELSTPVKKPQINDSVSSIWNEKNIQTVLFNPVYTGYITYQIYKYNDYEPVVKKSPYIEACRTEERQKELLTFRDNKVSKINLSKNTKRYSTPYLLSGLLVCKHCGKPYEVAATQKSNGQKHAYYRCRNRHTSRIERCSGVTYSQKIIEQLVIEKVEEVLKKFVKSGIFEKITKRLEENKEVVKIDLNTIQKQLEDKEKEAMNLASEISSLDKSDERNALKLEMYRKREDTVYDEISKLRKTLDDLKEQSEGKKEEDYSVQLIMDVIKEFTDVFQYSSPTKQKSILETLIHKIIVDDEFNVEIIFNWQIQEVESVIESKKIPEGIVSTIGSSESHSKVLENPDLISQTVLAKGLDSGTAFEILSIDIADVDVGKNIGAELQIEQAQADKNIAQAKAEERRAMAVANEQEMVAKVQEMKAKVVEAEAEVPMAMAEALRSGNFGIMDYMNYKNIQADTSMRDSIAKSTDKPDTSQK